MFERFTERSREVVVLAQQEARGLQHDTIDEAHLLLGLLLEAEGLAARVLATLGIRYDTAKARLIADVPRGPHPSDEPLPFTQRAKDVLEYALREALSLGHNYIGTEHLLLAMVTVEERADEQGFLVALGANPNAVRNEVMRMLQGPRPGGRSFRWRDPRRSREPAPESDVASPASEPAATDEPVAGEGLEAVPTHADRPATRDALGRARLAEVLAERMRRVRGEDTERPGRTWRDRRAKLRRDRRAAARAGSFMVHIHAPWGAGKSSLLNFLADDLRNRGGGRLRRRSANRRLSQWLVVEFSAWEHQRLEPPWWWLLSTIRRSAARELWHVHRGRWAWFWIRDVAWRLWNARVAWISVVLVLSLTLLAWTLDWFGLEGASLTAMKTAALGISAVLALGTTLWGRIHGTSRWLAVGSAEGAVKFLKRVHDPLGVYRRRFRWLVRAAGRPIVVFIDDLDRCRSDYVVALLEGIQTLFAADPVSYVVAADRTWLCDSFAKVYCDFQQSVGDPGRPLGFLFLEKTFQISIEIPPMSSGGQALYWRRLMSPVEPTADAARPPGAGAHWAADAFAGLQTQEGVERQMRELIEGGFDDEEVRRAAVRKLNAPELQSQLEGFLGQFAPLLENNPRAMKRLLNAYGIERDLLVRENRLPDQQERKQLVLFTILRLRWPRFAEHLLKHPADADRIAAGGSAPSAEHPYAALIDDPDVAALFQDSTVGAKLDRPLLERHAGRERLQPSSV